MLQMFCDTFHNGNSDSFPFVFDVPHLLLKEVVHISFFWANLRKTDTAKSFQEPSVKSVKAIYIWKATTGELFHMAWIGYHE